MPRSDSRNDGAYRRTCPARPLRPVGPEPQTPVFIVASPRPQVGKAFVARLLTVFFAGRRPRRLRSQSERARCGITCRTWRPPPISSTSDQMALFDRLIVDDGIAKVIDLAAAARRFFAIMECFVRERRSRLAIEPTILTPPTHPVAAGLRRSAATLSKRRSSFGLQRSDLEGTEGARPVPVRAPDSAAADSSSTHAEGADRRRYSFASTAIAGLDPDRSPSCALDAADVSRVPRAELRHC